MIQFKEKGGRPGCPGLPADLPHPDGRRHPALPGPDTAPVGGDQSQHVELTRDLAQRFNTLYGNTLIVPKLEPAALAARVADLQDPMIKMNKSAPENAAGVIRILDAPDIITRKIKRAVTDSDNQVRYDPVPPGVANLLDILACSSPAQDQKMSS